jgi:iron-sulfur cluster assembly protein
MNCPITFTEKALQMLKDARNNEEGSLIRVGVKGAGCSGYSWVLELTEKETPRDFKWDVDGLSVIIDPVSVNYLKGTEIDYVVQGLKAGFTFFSSVAKSTCGCGESFSV